MVRPVLHKIVILIGVLFSVWAGIHYLFPLIFPFAAGLLLALAAEPVNRFFQSRLHLPRAVSVGISVTLSLILILAVLLLLTAFLVRELGMLSGVVPNLESTVQDGLDLIERHLIRLVYGAPGGIRSVLVRCVSDLFSSSSSILDTVSNHLLQLASSALWQLPNSALTLFTSILSAFMISAKLQFMKSWIHQKIPDQWNQHYLPMLKSVRSVIVRWLQAQAKLSGMTFLITTMGLIFLRIPYAPLLGLIIALVDAIPMLGTGTVLIPWSIVSFLQHNRVQCIGLLGIYAAAALTRSAMEPRLVGKQLGLDPLVTLIALYTGFRLWGVLGMMIAPLLAVITVQLTELKQPPTAQA